MSSTTSKNSSKNSPTIKTVRKKGRTIQDIPCAEEEDIYGPGLESNNQPLRQDADNAAHLETRKLIEEKRRKFGTGWLLQTAGTPLLITKEKTNASEDPYFEQKSDIEVVPFVETNTDSETDVGILLSSELKDINSENVLLPPTTPTIEIYASPTTRQISNENSDSDAEEDEEDCEVFFVHLRWSEAALLLLLGPSCLLEKDGMTGKKRHSWHLSKLRTAQSFQEEDVTCITLTFEAERRDKRERIYEMENAEAAQSLLQLLEPFLSQNMYSLSTEGALECFRCDAQFSKSLVNRFLIRRTQEDGTNRNSPDELKEIQKCPHCGSTILLEIERKSDCGSPAGSENSKLPSKPINILKASEINKNISRSNESPTDRPKMRPRSASTITTFKNLTLGVKPVARGGAAESDSASSSSIECLSTTAEDGSDKQTMRSQSDITVLSNPSQSSFTVLSGSGSSTVSDEQPLDLSRTPTTDSFTSLFYKANSDRRMSSPVDILSPMVSSESQWYDSSSAQTTFQPSSPKTWGTSTILSKKEAETIGHKEMERSLETGDQENLKIWADLEQKVPGGNTFSKINHQAKLHVEVNVFHEREELLAGIYVNIVLQTTCEEVSGILIISTEMAYLFKNSENMRTEDVMVELERQPLRVLVEVFTLLGGQGFGFSFAPEPTVKKIFLFMLKDADVCNSFMASLEGLLKRTCEPCKPKFQLLTHGILSNIRSEILQQNLEIDSDAEPDVRLFLLGGLQRPSDGRPLETVQPVAFTVASDYLYIARVLYFKEVQSANLHFHPLDFQHISNLTEVHLSEDLLRVGLHFLDEDLDQESVWLFSAQSRASLASLLLALKGPWEELFGIDLQLSVTQNCACGL